MREVKRVPVIVALVAGLGVAGGCKAPIDLPSVPSPSSSKAKEKAGAALPGSCPAPVADRAVSNPSGNALAAAKLLPVGKKGACAKYERVPQFGKAWDDNNTAAGGHNGCDTRNDVLGASMTQIVWKNRVPCKVKSGVLVDPYSGRTIVFTAGRDTSDAVQIDHAVALKNAWLTGADKLPFASKVKDGASRLNLANDPLNLVAADGPLNQQKSANDASGWLPPNKSYRCAYVARQVAVKTKYGLRVTKAERATMLDVLSACPTQPLPTR